MKHDPGPVPRQYKGAHSLSTHTIKAAGSTEAHYLFRKACKNLLNVNLWQQFAGPRTAIFRVINQKNQETNTYAKEGDYLRIAIPTVPQPPAVSAFDWVQVESIREDSRPGYEYIAMRVRPAIPPFCNDGEVAHFFSRTATSTFCIERKGRRVIASIYGRNEIPNTSVHGFWHKLRNLVVALGGMLGLNKSQWKSLAKGWLVHAQ